MSKANPFGRQLRSIRKAHRVSQEQLAERAGRSVEAISNLERGINLPSFETLEQLARALSIPIRDFFEAFDDDSERAELMAQILAAARTLSTAELRVAAQQIELLGSLKSERSEGG